MMASTSILSNRMPRRPAMTFAISRLGWALVTLFLLSVLTFFSTSFRSPEETARALLGRGASQDQIDAFVAAHGLDRPILTRYVDWLGGILTGDWGKSPRTGEPVLDQILPRLGNTAMLAFLALVISVTIAFPLGSYMARRAGRRDDLFLLSSTVVFAAIPEFVIGIVLVVIFGTYLGWLPVTSSALNFSDSAAATAKAYVLPAATLAAPVVPYVARMCRTGVREALDTPAVQSATLRGLHPLRIWVSHTLRLAALPVINSLMISITYLLSGVLVVENLFGFPGMGQLTITAVNQGDLALLQGCVVVLGAMVILLNFVAELLSTRFNPKLKGHAS